MFDNLLILEILPFKIIFLEFSKKHQKTICTGSIKRTTKFSNSNKIQNKQELIKNLKEIIKKNKIKAKKTILITRLEENFLFHKAFNDKDEIYTYLHEKLKMPPSNFIVNFKEIKRSTNNFHKTNFLVFASPLEIIKEYEFCLKKAKLKLLNIDLDILCIIDFLKKHYKFKNANLVHIGKEMSYICTAKEEEIDFIQSIDNLLFLNKKKEGYLKRFDQKETIYISGDLSKAKQLEIREDFAKIVEESFTDDIKAKGAKSRFLDNSYKQLNMVESFDNKAKKIFLFTIVIIFLGFWIFNLHMKNGLRDLDSQIKIAEKSLDAKKDKLAKMKKLGEKIIKEEKKLQNLQKLEGEKDAIRIVFTELNKLILKETIYLERLKIDESNLVIDFFISKKSYKAKRFSNLILQNKILSKKLEKCQLSFKSKSPQTYLCTLSCKVKE